MAWRILPTTITSGIAVELDLDSLFVAQGVTIGSNNSSAVRWDGAADQQVVVHGTIVALLTGITSGASDGSTAGGTITVGETGRVTSLDGTAISMNGSAGHIVNRGVIESLDPMFGSGISLSGGPGSAFTIENAGVIEAGRTGVGFGGAFAAVDLVNTGRISSDGFAINDDTEGPTTIRNTGIIEGDVDLGAGDDLFDGRDGVLLGDLYGSGGNDRLMVGAGDQSLHGGIGNDTLLGGAGADDLNGDAGLDHASYAGADAGVWASLAAPSTNRGDAAGDSYSSIEGLVGSSHGDRLTGNAAGNRLIGGAGNDLIAGREGNDTLYGGAGADDFLFDTALSAATNTDRIVGFEVGLDDIRLENAIFTALSAGALSAGAFTANASGTAQDASDRIIYETDTGYLRYDADGMGGAAGVRFARLDLGLALTADDFVVV